MTRLEFHRVLAWPWLCVVAPVPHLVTHCHSFTLLSSTFPYLHYVSWFVGYFYHAYSIHIICFFCCKGRVGNQCFWYPRREQSSPSMAHSSFTLAMMALTIASSCCRLASSIFLFTLCQSRFRGRSPHVGFTLRKRHIFSVSVTLGNIIFFSVTLRDTLFCVSVTLRHQLS